jgi:putative SOS response-associated peptidase YedK
MRDDNHRAECLHCPSSRPDAGPVAAHQFEHWLSGNMTVEELKPAPNDSLQRWAVSKRVNSSKADKDEPTLIKPVGQAA